MSQEKVCCKNNKWLLFVLAIIVATAIISGILVFVPIDWPSDIAIKFITLYSIGFCFIVGFSFLAYYSVKYYCNPYNEERELGLVTFALFSIFTILIIFLIADNIEKSYYESHFHNSLEDGTINQAYSQLNCRIIDMFRDSEHDNQPIWETTKRDDSTNEHAHIIHNIPISEVCQ